MNRLNSTHGPEKTVEYFTAHRGSYITAADFEQIAELGIRAIRLPLTWAAFADALAYIDPVYGSFDAKKQSVVVPDPFYAGSHAMVTIPRDWLAQMIRHAGSYGLKVLLDIHAMPGGSSIGTYSGIWPNPPKFWNSNATLQNKSATLQDAGLAIVQAFVDWVEDLDMVTFRAVVGLTLMNEPGHLSAGLKDRYVQEPDILRWLAASADIFRWSKLVGWGVKLYLNIIETAFDDFFATVPPWYFATFSQEEQMAWAVMDMHYYMAWSPGNCDGRVIEGGGYRCGDAVLEVERKLSNCSTNMAAKFHQTFPGLKSCSEFSVGSYQDARYACNGETLMRTFLKTQVRTLEMYDIQPIFWTWRMPFGRVFEPGWSLKKIAGYETMRPAEVCNSGPARHDMYGDQDARSSQLIV